MSEEETAMAASGVEGNYYSAEWDGQADDSFSSEAWQAVANLVLWRSPVFTLTWLVLLVLVTGLLSVYQYSALTLACLVVLVQLLITRIAITMGPWIAGGGGDGFDAEEFVAQRRAFSPDQVFRFSRGVADAMAHGLLQWHDVLDTKSANKVLPVAGGLVVAIVLGFLPLELVCLLGTLVGFSLPKVYELEQDRIHQVWAVVVERTHESDFVQDRVLPVVHSLLASVEPLVGQFE